MKFFLKIFFILLIITIIFFSFKNNYIENKVEKILISLENGKPAIWNKKLKNLKTNLNEKKIFKNDLYFNYDII